MNKFFKAMMLVLCLMGANAAFAQSADKILGVYEAVEEGKESKVRFTKQADGTYQGQIFWLKNATNADGTPKYDLKNPDAEKRKVRADNVIVVYGVRYDAAKNMWKGGHVYNPTNGKTYTVEISFTDEKTLNVRGKLGPFGKSVFWKKVE